MPYYDTYFTEKEFFAQIVEFRKLMGDKRFWEKDIYTRQLAIDGLGHAWLNTRGDNGELPTKEQNDRWAEMHFATIEEYTRRERMVLFGSTNVI